MLKAIGAKSVEELFQSIPAKFRLKEPLRLARAAFRSRKSSTIFSARAAENSLGYTSFLGAGVYQHLRSVVTDAIVQRGEFLTSYTPYQAEISQGTLHAIFEFQTLMCQLTGQEVANASMYDGSTALTEAVLMAERLTERHRVLVARSLHPEYRQVLQPMRKISGLDVEEIGFTQPGQMDLRRTEALQVSRTSPPSRCSLRISLAWWKRLPRTGGSGATERRLAGHCDHGSRLAGLAATASRKPTLSRWKVKALAFRPATAARLWASSLRAINCAANAGATRRSNHRCGRPARICSDAGDARAAHSPREGDFEYLHQSGALCALAATIHLCLLGKEGLREMAEQNLAKARFAQAELEKIPGVKAAFSGPDFQ